jgi:hypothetical protein
LHNEEKYINKELDSHVSPNGNTKKNGELFTLILHDNHNNGGEFSSLTIACAKFKKNN